MSGKEMDLLRARSRDFGIELTPDQLDLFQIYLDELWDWNQRVNLIGLSRMEDVINELLLDSLLPLPWLPEEGTLLDVGSGAGLPGIPLKICSPRLQTDLLEPHSKKVSFLKHVSRLLNLKDLRVIRGRMGHKTPPPIRPHYDIVTARAVADLGRVIGLCAHRITRAGGLVGFLGAAGEKDLEVCRGVMEEYGLKIAKKRTYRLPGKRKRMVVFLK
ncbi:MAG: 16S rRNA (guanine(527)-N(7))-methyltransferase RsmG, partial [Deltaproteobacteria bacterium]|nr:16S rRNA (guanine(527)-N(7))-methyltransferase RsmG [Deltaproteobacteria bacterium]MBW2130839.1 16S rRNA (guanine(527)-N(7))-methyltransferase RsmG [Deltaproteobacteria bacterium]